MLLVPIYIVSSVSFILGLKMLSHPATARNGNLAAAAGMALAIFATIFMYIDPETGQGLNNYGWIFSGLILGSIVGTLAAKRVQMTAMPEMVSLFNGMGRCLCSFDLPHRISTFITPRHQFDIRSKGYDPHHCAWSHHRFSFLRRKYDCLW